PSGDHCGPPAPRGSEVNCQASPPSIDNINSCGWSGRPSFSGTRTNTRYLPSGDQRGDESRVPLVNCFVSPLPVETNQMEVLYPSLFSFTVTFTKATREPSGATCGSAIQLKLNRSLSVMFRFCARPGVATNTVVSRVSQRAYRILKFLSGKEVVNGGCYSTSRSFAGQ